MLRSALTRWIVGTLLLIAVLGVMRFKPWRHWGRTGSALALAHLNVGFLPVT